MYIGFERIVATAAVKTVAALTIPAGAHGAELQSDTNHVRYTMTNGNPNPTAIDGMLLLTTDGPKQFLIEDIRRIAFTRDGVVNNGSLNIHYFAGRNL